MKRASMVVVVAACLPPKPATDDALKALRQAVAAAELTMPFAQAACDAIRDAGSRDRCHAGLSAVADARAVLTAADACAAGDRECLAKCEEAARAILPKIRPLASAPAVSASAAASTPSPTPGVPHGQ